MIQQLSDKYSKPIAYSFLLLFLVSASPSAFSRDRYDSQAKYLAAGDNSGYLHQPSETRTTSTPTISGTNDKHRAHAPEAHNPTQTEKVTKGFIGGPNQPEMSSFKSVGTDNMVNLFTGDFSYNIPLMDVGGYPINIFYDGGVTPEQEASWVGLGWNINPGNVSRNMRGIPDDFNGEDTMIQSQRMKPNQTFGVTLGADIEVVGIKSFKAFSGSIGASLGVSYNNYLGPALDQGLKGSTGIKLASKAGSEKSLSLGGGLSANISSRNGLTISPNLSLTTNSFSNVSALSTGVGLSTSYNSKSGIKALQISEQMSYNYNMARYHGALMNPDATNSISHSLLSNSISFAKPSYVPALRMQLTNESYSGHFQAGVGVFGLYPSFEVEVYKQTSEVAKDDQIQYKPMVGYLYYQKANNNASAVMDFTRFNDNEVTENTPIISAPQYSYDVFSIQGEGTGGSIRAYRNDQGSVRDNISRSKDKNVSIGADIGVGHFGANFNKIKTPSTIGEWGAGNKLKTTLQFIEAKGDAENVYFRNPGETSVLNPTQFEQIGGTDLVRFKLGGSNANPTIEPFLEHFSKDKKLIGTNSILATSSAERKKRTQVISMLTAEEASKVGLDTDIKSYNATTPLNGLKNLQFDIIKRVGGYRKKHHISQINVTEAGGRRYVYGIPVYDTVQKDFSFTVNADIIPDEDQVLIGDGEPSLSSEMLSRGSKKDGFVQITQTPAYAHSFLLTGLLSPDYVDVTGDGITEDDLGDAVKFNYTQVKVGSNWAYHKWRTPLTPGNTKLANANAGNRTERKDDKGLVSYGVRESWYAHSIESKTMIALFTLEDRKDGRGTVTEFSGVSDTSTQKRLKKIDLFSKADLKKNGLSGSKPIKTVWFAYSYKLCGGSAGTPDNSGEAELLNGINVNANRGKLTLDSIYFTFNGKNRASKNKYVFSYGTTSLDNPSYARGVSDRWGNYKPTSQNPSSLQNSDYPYAVQTKAAADGNAGAWALKKVLLPSGGQLEVEYESDDYAYVQNRRAAAMFEIIGLGKDATSYNNKLYSYSGHTINEHDYVFIKVPVAVNNREEVFQKYLQGMDQFAFKLAVNMPKGMEYVNSYGTLDLDGYGKYSSNIIWIKLKRVDKELTPLSLTALDYLRERLPGQAFVGYDVSDDKGIEQIGKMIGGWLDGLKSAFSDPINYLRREGGVQTIVLGTSFVRLNVPDGYKYGGGQRVKRVRLKDNWQAMTGQYTSEYGQEYDYSTTENFNGAERKISSGVASYEPSIGGEENPFQTMMKIADKLPMGPTSYGAIELPVLDAFFPAPIVGYSKVTVRSLRKGTVDTTKKSRSGIGRQVTEFFTAKDFPVYYSHTAFDPSSDKTDHKASVLAFFNKYAFDSRALSQGFLVETNDMHGKLKSQSSYGEGDTASRINYTENFYRNTGSKALEEKFDFVYGNRGGVIEEGNMGIDVELMTDTREFSVKSNSLEIQGQADLFPVLFPFWLPFIWPVSGNSENIYRAVTTTKVINYHSILDSVVVIDKGSQVSTKNLVYDAETGSVVVNRTQNEFNQPIYTTTYPAYWAYSGMGPAYKNIDAVYNGVSFFDGQITIGTVPMSSLESGDELYLLNPGTNPNSICAIPSDLQVKNKLWVYDKNKSVNGLTNPTPDFVFLDENGNLYTKNNVSFRIIRSGKRNYIDNSAATITLLKSPIEVTNNLRKLSINSSSQVINATAVDYKEQWKIDKSTIRKYITVYNPSTCSTDEVLDCNGMLETHINPYRKGLVGNFKAYQSKVYYSDRTESSPLQLTNISKNGFLNNFSLYWDFNPESRLIPDIASSKWIWKDQVTHYNAKGQELETKNALGIFTAAQYGYNKSLPISITNNSKYSETYFDGFEDYGFQESLNNVGELCDTKAPNISSIINATVRNADSLNLSAHTGKYVLNVNAGTSASINLNIGNQNDSGFALPFRKDTFITNPQFVAGVNTTVETNPTNSIPYVIFPNSTYQPSNVPVYDFSKSYRIGVYHNPNNDEYPDCYWDNCLYDNVDFKFVLGGYYITSGGVENFRLFIHRDQYFSSDISFSPTSFSVIITNSKNEVVSETTGNQMSALSADVFAADIAPQTLCAGNYKMDIVIHANVSNTARRGYYRSDVWRMLTIGVKRISYVANPPLEGSIINGNKLISSTTCIRTTPIAASDSMLNASFQMPTEKNMLVSVWAKKPCVTTPCNTVDNSDIQVLIRYKYLFINKTVGLKPTGPIIDGWQQYEGSLSIPALLSNNLRLSFVNNSTAQVYFDDLRIHPYNANMKSYVYDPVNLRLVAELDANNYATFYEYDEEGTLIRTKVETKEGIKTINETRSFKQRKITELQ